MSIARAKTFRLEPDAIHVVCRQLGLQPMPTVLDVRSTHCTIDHREAAFDRAHRGLRERELITDGDVHPDLQAALLTLHRPERELSMRWVTPQGIARVSVARGARWAALARQIGDDVTITRLGDEPTADDMASALTSQLSASAGADVEPVGAPLPEFAESLSGTNDPRDIADRIRALGTPSRAATLMGVALSTRQSFAEIVCSTMHVDDGRISRVPGAVAVFYTARGRLVSVPSKSPTGQLWATLRSGSDLALHKAICRLAESGDEEGRSR